jgi:Domain of unknown function (DUF5122) beta-propeller
VIRAVRIAIPAAIACAALAVPSAVAAYNAPQSVVVSQEPVSWTPQILDGLVRAEVQVGNTMIVGGTFTQVKNKNGVTLTRNGIMAFDAQTGVIDPNFAPDIEGGEVSTLSAAPGGTAVFAGGEFQTVNGVTMKRLVKLNLADGSIDPTFKASISGSWVEDSQVLGSDLYIGGAFSAVNGVTRGRFAAVDVNTGAVDPNVDVNFADKRQGTLRVAHFDISPDGTKLVATGTFLTANGLDRAQIAMLNLTTHPVSVSSWETDSFKPACSTHFDTYLRDVDFAPDGSYFIVGDTGAWMGGPNAGVLCDSVSRWDPNATGSGQLPTWVDYTGGDSITYVAATGTAVYAGGHQRYINNPFAGDKLGPGGVTRFGIVALDPVNGMPYTWNPGRDPRGSGVWALLATSDGLWVGSDTAYIDGLYRPRISMLPVVGGTAVPAANPGSLPGQLVTMGSGSSPTGRSFNGTTAGAASTLANGGVDWSHVRGAFMLSGTLYTGWDNGHLYARSYDGSTFGPATDLNLNGLTSSYFPIASLTGMFFDKATGRLYYTVSGDSHLYYRYFEPESGIVGAQTFTASGNGDGLSWSNVSTMTMADGHIYYVVSSFFQQNLYRIDFVNGKPVPGTQVLVSGPSAHDGQTWPGRAMFVESN